MFNKKFLSVLMGGVVVSSLMGTGSAFAAGFVSKAPASTVTVTNADGSLNVTHALSDNVNTCHFTEYTVNKLDTEGNPVVGAVLNATGGVDRFETVKTISTPATAYGPAKTDTYYLSTERKLVVGSADAIATKWYTANGFFGSYTNPYTGVVNNYKEYYQPTFNGPSDFGSMWAIGSAAIGGGLSDNLSLTTDAKGQAVYTEVSCSQTAPVTYGGGVKAPTLTNTKTTLTSNNCDEVTVAVSGNTTDGAPYSGTISNDFFNNGTFGAFPEVGFVSNSTVKEIQAPAGYLLNGVNLTFSTTMGKPYTVDPTTLVANGGGLPFALSCKVSGTIVDRIAPKPTPTPTPTPTTPTRVSTPVPTVPPATPVDTPTPETNIPVNDQTPTPVDPPVVNTPVDPPVVVPPVDNPPVVNTPVVDPPVVVNDPQPGLPDAGGVN